MTTHNLVLASTSPYRRALLEGLGVPFEVVDPAVDEEAVRNLAPEDMVRALAVAKAEAVGRPGALVIGSDQCVDLDGTILGKPGSIEAAIAQLTLLSGRTHRLITAVAVHDPALGRTEVDVDIHRLTMRTLESAQLATYVARDQPLACAGSYRLEACGLALFDSIEADPTLADATAIVGLPVLRTLRLLRGFGYDVLS